MTALMNEKLRMSQQLSLMPEERRAWTEKIAALQAEADKRVCLSVWTSDQLLLCTLLVPVLFDLYIRHRTL